LSLTLAFTSYLAASLFPKPRKPSEMFVATIVSLTITLAASVDAVAVIAPTEVGNNQTELLIDRLTCTPPEWHSDYPGEDSHNLPTATYEACCEMCMHDLSCGAYTWTNYQGGTCYMKYKRSRSEWKGALPDGSASIISAEAYRCNVLTKDVDYDGNDLFNLPAARPESCCQASANSRLCRSFTWSDYNGGTCWYEEAGKPVVKPGVVSALLY
jgi:hypothetical protein